MSEITRVRLFGVSGAFDHPVVLWVSVALAALLIAAPLVSVLLHRTGRIDDAHFRELIQRCLSWLVLAPLMIAPVLLGAAAFIGSVLVIMLLCYREFARATGFFRERTLSGIVLLAIATLVFAVFDHWYGFFVAIPALTVSVIAAVAVLADRPAGYIQRVALGVFAFVLIGVGLGHFAYLGNDTHYRPLIVWLLVSVEMNDVFAYVSGRLFGKRRLAPNTSPGKTIAGAAGALVLTTAISSLIGYYAFAGTALATAPHLIALGLIISVGGQLGDLMLSSVKRDLGLKDMGTLIPGHGGLLDRFDSLLLVAPAVFHYVAYYTGIGLDQPTRILSGH